MSMTKEFLSTRKHTQAHRLTKKVKFDSLGLTFFDRVILITDMEDFMGVDLHDAHVEDGITSIEDASALFAKRLRGFETQK